MLGRWKRRATTPADPTPEQQPEAGAGPALSLYLASGRIPSAPTLALLMNADRGGPWRSLEEMESND